MRICIGYAPRDPRGLARCGAASLEKIKGRRSEEIATILGRENSPQVVHRNDLVVLQRRRMD